jgi:hypothetical protein
LILSAAIFLVSLGIFYLPLRNKKSAEILFGTLILADLFLFSQKMIWPESIELTKLNNLTGLGKITCHQKSRELEIGKGGATRMFATDENQHINRDPLGNTTIYTASIAQQWALGLLNIPAYFGLETTLGYTTLPPKAPIIWNLPIPRKKILKRNSVACVLKRNRDGIVSTVFKTDPLPYVFLPPKLEATEDRKTLANRIRDKAWNPSESALFLKSSGEVIQPFPLPPPTPLK